MPTKPTSKLPILLLLGLLALTVAALPAQTHIPPPSGSDPGNGGPWKLPGRDPELDRRIDQQRGVNRNAVWAIRCSIQEIEELGRIYVEDASDRSRYWIQLPTSVKIRAVHRQSFGGRKKLKLKDLEVGQRLVLTLRQRDDEILKVQVRPPLEPRSPAE